MNTTFQKKAGRTRTGKIPNGATKIETNYFLTYRPDIVTYVTFINQVNIGIDHRMATSNIKLYLQVEEKQMLTKSRYY